MRELEEVLHTEIYPGTEIMVDVGTHHFVKSAAGGHSVLVVCSMSLPIWRIPLEAKLFRHGLGATNAEVQLLSLKDAS